MCVEKVFVSSRCPFWWHTPTAPTKIEIDLCEWPKLFFDIDISATSVLFKYIINVNVKNLTYSVIKRTRGNFKTGIQNKIPRFLLTVQCDLILLKPIFIIAAFVYITKSQLKTFIYIRSILVLIACKCSCNVTFCNCNCENTTFR